MRFSITVEEDNWYIVVYANSKEEAKKKALEFLKELKEDKEVPPIKTWKIKVEE